MDRLAVPSDPSISPDGSDIAYVLETTDVDADRRHRELWAVDTRGGTPRRLTTGPADTTPRWAPDGSRLAFLRQNQVWTLSGSQETQLTSRRLGAGTPQWSPDGRRIAFCAPVQDDSASSSDPIVIDRLRYKSDGVGLHRAAHRHLFVTDVDTGDTVQVTSGKWHASDPSWSPDGTSLAFCGALDADSDVTLRSGAYVIPANGGAPERIAALDHVVWVGWDDSGAALVVGRPTVTDGHVSLYRIANDGGPMTDLSGQLDRNVMPGLPGYPGGRPQMSGAGGVLFCARDRGCTQVYRVDVNGGQPVRLVGSGEEVVSGLSVATRAPRAAVVIASPESYGEIAVVELSTGDTRRCTDYSGSSGVALHTPVSREFLISDGTTVHGWLLRDPSLAVPGPLLIDVHGGPHNAWSPVPTRSHAYHQTLVSRGWSVLLLNPRASDGYGEKFFQATYGAWGIADQNDFLEPLDALVNEGIADPRRLAITGYSYGGYTTCWLTGHTDRFAAAVAGGLISDLVSLAGTSDLGHGRSIVLIGGTPHEQSELVRSQSPMESVTSVTSPTLILHGLADDRCPASQGEQWFTALRERGVPTQLVLYPGASHLFRDNGLPSHRRDYAERLMAWLETYCPPTEES